MVQPLFSILRTLCRPAALAALALVAVAGCRKEDMADQPKVYHPYQGSTFFADGTSARPIPTGTIARGHLRLDPVFFTAMQNGAPVNFVPVSPSGAFRNGMTREDLESGQVRFNIYCAPCHGLTGDGNGMIVQRGMKQPPSLVQLDRPLTDREKQVQNAPIGHYFDVITNGFGGMYSYNDRIAVEDRWRVAAYVRALQLSQNAGKPLAGPAVGAHGQLYTEMPLQPAPGQGQIQQNSQPRPIPVTSPATTRPAVQ